MRRIQRPPIYLAALLVIPVILAACDDPLPTFMEVLEVEAGGYHLHLEPMPDHIHEGDPIVLQVAVHEETSTGEEPVTGLTPEFHIIESDGTETSYEGSSVTVPEDGHYQTEHTFTVPGEAEIGFHFTGSGGSASEAEFAVEVHEAHAE